MSQLAPENTMAAFKLAAIHKIHWLEFDVMLSKDFHPIIFHDETLRRTSNDRGHVADRTLSQLKKVDVGSWFHSSFKGEMIPTLEEVLELMQTKKLNAVIEIKPTLGRDVITAKKTIETIQRTWPEGLDHMIFASFSLASLITVRRILPKQAIGFGMDIWNGAWQEMVKALDCYSIHVNHLILSQKRIEALKSSGCALLAYTVNKQKRAESLRKKGVDGFFSDCPNKL